MHRFYVLGIMPTLFGEWTVISEWGHDTKVIITHAKGGRSGNSICARRPATYGLSRFNSTTAPTYSMKPLGHMSTAAFNGAAAAA